MPWHRSVRWLRAAVAAVVVTLAFSWYALSRSDQESERRLNRMEELVTDLQPVCYVLQPATPAP